MEWPEGLVNDAKKKMEPFDVEGFVLGKGDEQGSVMVVGEAPGENEANKGEPFIGRAGDELNKQLKYMGLSREELYITSVVRSRPYKWVKTNKKGTGGMRKANRKPNKKEIFAHAELLDYQIEQMDPEIIIALGGVAYERLTGDKRKMSDVLGDLIRTPVQVKEGDGYGKTEKEYAIIPLYHPAAIFYNPGIKDHIYESLDQVRVYLKKELN
ncbi:DNA polymerase [Halobacillus karajensis]|uniref:Uracil-DNA glycosylase, family 4 n=2 Tax=Halobacillus karajensis TaxID=195088 RepID=A0A024P9T9_9BACI|nr:uracil-DNA glycosylase [Halobacillus karajensis]CDQ21572.1 uracil-DNA glycosylase, family 4 [Halobacillus karajensis]CDQ25506.1 uracil-DNA glycosylase, family 4 [Halobacillus karajensis]CDQ28963.1 uracil-DNA glycosylase, family 4 [Halobacillus karajensis]SEI08850.1 DNA polymerase [Halobacillus karajensis]